ncbi:hypothetical protein SUGI_0999020 [Cryptomeria japonica]|nr:hypothetical protein SUGI_0999020 [Cryptomeria japonica]
MEVVREVEGQLKIFSDGSVLRLPHPTLPASSHFTHGVASKDVIINPETGASGRAESPDEWLSPSVVDFNRLFLAGESAGGNIVYHVGLQIADVDGRPLVVKGGIPIHPFFGSEERVESEGLMFFETCKIIWSIGLPVGSTRDYPFCNPAVSPLKPGLKLPPVLVALAGKDEIKVRGEMFYEHVKSCGKEAELMVEESGIHAYHIFLPQYEGTLRLIHTISDFINGR